MLTEQLGKRMGTHRLGGSKRCMADQLRGSTRLWDTTFWKTIREARIDTCKDRIAETERVKERKRARVERGAVDVPGEPGDKDDEQEAVRHADASGGCRLCCRG